MVQNPPVQGSFRITNYQLPITNYRLPLQLVHAIEQLPAIFF
nr:hypothetical protein [Chroococcidiopsis sp. CCNUC1]